MSYLIEIAIIIILIVLNGPPIHRIGNIKFTAPSK